MTDIEKEAEIILKGKTVYSTIMGRGMQCNICYVITPYKEYQ